jgi:hypothetical protein
MRIKNTISGNNTKNQATPGAPALHIKFNIQVQNKMYTTLMINIIGLFVTLQEYEPTQYMFVLPKF